MTKKEGATLYSIIAGVYMNAYLRGGADKTTDISVITEAVRQIKLLIDKNKS